MKEPGNEETVLLHFSAGPPYEDIAFRVVNREWEYSHKRLVAHTSLDLNFDISQGFTGASGAVLTEGVYRFGLISAET